MYRSVSDTINYLQIPTISVNRNELFNNYELNREVNFFACIWENGPSGTRMKNSVFSPIFPTFIQHIVCIDYDRYAIE